MISTPMPSKSPILGSRQPRTSRIVFQFLAFLTGLALAGWAISKVFSPTNRAQLDRLFQAPIRDIAALLGLCLLTILINGLLFELQIRPVRRLRFAHVQSVNALASLLNFLPFKISLIFRILIHRTRDGLAILTIGAWFAAVAGILAITAIPVLGATLLRSRIDTVWFIWAGLGVLGLLSVTLLICSVLAHEPRWGALSAHIQRFPLPLRTRQWLFAPDGPWDKLHEGVRMLAHPGVVSLCVLLRFADIAVHTVRLLIAARILGLELDIEHALIAGSAYFLIGVLAPAGQVGVRETGTAGVLKALLPGINLESFMILPLLVTATEAFTLVILAGPACAYLRPLRLGPVASAQNTPASPGSFT